MNLKSPARLFDKGSIICTVASEPAVMLGAGRALLLQVAHPVVASGVAEFSNFQDEPFKRLLGTLEATYAVVFGFRDTAIGVGERIQRIHEKIRSSTYRASDPENLLWVHATLFDTMRAFFIDLVRPLSADEQEVLYKEMARVAELFGCPTSAQPADCKEFDRYFAAKISSFEIGDTAQRLAHEIIQPELATVPSAIRVGLSPFMAISRLWAVGTIPERLRDGFELGWDDADQHQLENARRLTKALFHATPRSLRIAPGWLQGRYLLRRAARHVAESQNGPVKGTN